MRRAGWLAFGLLLIMAPPALATDSTQTPNCSPSSECQNQGGGASPWTTPTNVTSDDGTNFAVNADKDQTPLVVLIDSFSIPAGATITGFRVDHSGYSDSGSASKRVVDLQLTADGGSTACGTTVKQTQYTSSDATYNPGPGGSSDTWGGCSPSITALNSGQFGVMLWKDEITGTGYSMFIDWVRITVSYTGGATTTTTSSTTSTSTSSTTSTSTSTTSSTSTSSTSTTSTSTTSTTSTSVILGALFLSAPGLVSSGDPIDMAEAGTGADGTMEACTQSSTCQVHGPLNGGPSNHWADRVNVASGESRYRTLHDHPGTASAALCSRWHVVTVGATRDIEKLREDRTGDGVADTDGCYVRLNTSTKTLALRHGTTTLATSSRSMQTAYCTGGLSCTDGVAGDQACATAGLGECINGTCVSVNRPCTSGTESTDCPSGQSCGTCTTSTGEGCYFGDVCLVQTNTGTTSICSLVLDGTVAATGTATTASGLLVGGMYGALGTESGALDATVGSVRYLPGETGTPYGFVQHVAPSVNAAKTFQSMTTNNCTGSDHTTCVNDTVVTDWEIDATSDLRTNTGSKTERFLATTPAVSLHVGETVDGVLTSVVGRTTSGAATREIRAAALICTDYGTCSTSVCTGDSERSCTSDADCYPCTFTQSPVQAVEESTTQKVRLRYWATAAPSTTSSDWTDSIAGLGLQVSTSPDNSAGIRVDTLTGDVLVAQPTAPLPITACNGTGGDHNLGTDDGLCTIWCNGNSEACGTLAVQCIGGSEDGQSCTGEKYCADVPTKDAICEQDSDCDVCENRRLEFSPAGYLCGPNNGDATCDLGTCSGGACTGDASVSCSTDPDCDLGNCGACSTADCTSPTEDPGGSCIEQCPGGVCPTDRSTPCDELARIVGANAVVAACQGGETNVGFTAARLQHVLEGQSGTGIGYAVDKVGTSHCTCSTGGDCGTSGTCSGGVCTAGSKSTCTGLNPASECTTAICQHARPDFFVQINESDNATLLYPAPNCTGLQSVHVDGPTGTSSNMDTYCSQCPALACLSDSQCGGRSSDSECLAGRFVGVSGFCTHTVGGTVCSEDIRPCNIDGDCEITGQSCTAATGTALRRGEVAAGTCTCNDSMGSCSTDADCGDGHCVDTDGDATPDTCQSCPPDYACVGTPKRCRLECPSGTGCPSGDTCNATDPRVCEARCTCPTNASDMTDFPDAAACTSDNQCPHGAVTQQGLTRHWRAECQGGECWCGGPVGLLDPADACYHAALRIRRSWAGVDGIVGLRALRDAIAQAVVDAGDTDGGPLLYVTTLPHVLGGIGNTHRPDVAFTNQTNAAILTELCPHCIDLQGAMADIANEAGHADFVHWLAAMAIAGGGVGTRIAPGMGLRMKAIGVCATGADWTLRPQGYCHEANGDLVSGNPICSLYSIAGIPDTPCASGKFCEVVPCDDDTDCPDDGDACNVAPDGL